MASPVIADPFHRMKYMERHGSCLLYTSTDLGSVQCVRLGSGWRAYIPAAYNASAGGHTVNVTVNLSLIHI